MESPPWESFLSELRSCMRARTADLTLFHAAGDGRDTHVMSSDAEDGQHWDRVESIYRARYMATDPLPQSAIHPGQIVQLDTAGADPQFREFLISNGIAHVQTMGFAEPGGMRCWLILIRKDAACPFGSEERAIFAGMLPHLERALRIYATIMRRQTERDLYVETVDHLAVGCILLNGEGKVIHSNHAAISIMAEHANISIRNQQIYIADPGFRRHLERAIDSAMAARVNCRSRPQSQLVKIPSVAGTVGLLVHAVPIVPYYQGRQATHVIIYISTLGHSEALNPFRNASQELLAQLFDLTKQESRLVLLLAEGKTLAAASIEMNIAERTARNYSKTIYQKIGIQRQSELVRLVYSSIALLK